MPIEQLIFAALNGCVLAMHRDSGEIVWSNKALKQGFMTLLLDGDRLIASVSGHVYCLNPQTGKTLWENRIKGHGWLAAPTALISVRSQSRPSRADDLNVPLMTAAMIASI